MTQRWVAAMMVAGAVVAPAPLAAHDVTYTGTVEAVERNRYAASDGILARLDVHVSARKRTITVDVTPHTKVWRGSSAVSFEDANVRKGEPVAVTIIDEEPERGAIEIRLDARGR